MDLEIGYFGVSLSMRVVDFPEALGISEHEALMASHTKHYCIAANRTHVLFRIDTAVPSNIFRFSCSGTFSSSIEETARSIEPNRCG